MPHSVPRPRRSLVGLLLAALPPVVACDARPDGSDDPAANPVADTTVVEAEPGRTLPAPRVESGGLVIEDLLVAEPVTGERAALYLTVRSREGDVLLGIEADGADSASLHQTSMEEGVMRMRPVSEIPVPAGGEAALRPGGLHGMLEGLTASWAVGDTVRLRLRFRDAGVVEAPALVIPYIDLDTRFREAAGGG